MNKNRVLVEIFELLYNKNESKEALFTKNMHEKSST